MNDIVQALYNGSTKYQKAKDAIVEIGLATSRGHHYAMIEDFNKKSNGSISNKEIIMHELSDRLFEGITKCNKTKSFSIFEAVKIILVVSFQDKEKIRNNPLFATKTLILLDPSKHYSLELSEESHLVTEHFNDGLIFNMIGIRYIQKKYKLSREFLSFFNRNGGGATIKDVFIHERSLKNHLCLFIVDNDRKYPDGEDGDTATNLLDELIQSQDWDHKEVYKMKRLSEIENLIPFKLIHNKGKSLHDKIGSIDHSYFDFKLGLSAKVLKDKDCYKYWKSMLGDLPKYSDIQAKQDSYQVVKGWGKSTLSTFIKSNLEQLCLVTDQELSTSQRLEYAEIGEKIFNWCVAIPPIRS